MISRTLGPIAFSETWGRQMRFIAGPRQCGKTTLAKAQLAARKSMNLYYSWDLRSVRDRYKANELFFTQDSPPRQDLQWVCFDEIHKYPNWKNILKAIYDSMQDHYRFIVTGSAKLDLFRKAGDSLTGRYFTFHLMPLTVSEVTEGRTSKVPERAEDFLINRLNSKPASQEGISDLLKWSGFPEPFSRQSDVFYKKWSADYLETVIREDIGALTRIIDHEHLLDLYRMLPELVGGPVSQSSLASHLQISQPTVRNHLKRLADFFLIFKLHPYSKNITRSLLKAPKCYLYDWAQNKDPGSRFENFAAVQLLTWTFLWQETSADRFGLFYVRTKQKEEIDFLLMRDDKPWLLVETKTSDGALSKSHYRLQSMLGNVPLIRLCQEDGVARMESKNAARISASRFFSTTDTLSQFAI